MRDFDELMESLFASLRPGNIFLCNLEAPSVIALYTVYKITSKMDLRQIFKVAVIIYEHTVYLEILVGEKCQFDKSMFEYI